MKTRTDSLTEQVIGEAMAVHRKLGPGFLESVYQKALAVELTSLGISYREQAPLVVTYREKVVGEFVDDFVIEGGLIVELKSTSAITMAHEVQLVNYLSATGIENGLLINFGAPSLEFRRKFRNPKNPVNLVNPVKKYAFTILELLVAMVLLSVLLVLLLNMVTSATALWRSSENRADAYREARAAMAIIARDLGGIVAATNTTNQFLLNDAAKTNFTNSLVYDKDRQGAVLFLTALPASAQAASNKSDVCQVGYFLAFDKTAMSTNLPGGQPTLNLYRYFLSSDATFTNLINTNLNSPFTNGISPTDNTVDLLARNVREFRITPLVQTNSSLSTNFTPATNNPLPALLEISITAVNQEAARRLTNKADWTTNSPARPITQAQQTFTTRVQLNRPQ